MVLRGRVRSGTSRPVQRRRAAVSRLPSGAASLRHGTTGRKRVTTCPAAAYAAAGVDIDAGDRAVELMRAAVEGRGGRRSSAASAGSAAAVAVPAGYREPVLVSSTDGVGTKTAIAAALGRFDTIGIDLVAMCADDVVCSGRRAALLPRLHRRRAARSGPVAELVGGVAAGCREAGCALVGGETAEHPGLMEPERVRHGRLLRRDRRARPAHRRVGRPRGRRDPRPRLERAPLERLLARAQPPRPMGPRPGPAVPGASLTLGPEAAAAAVAAEPASRARDPRRGAARSDADLRPADPRPARALVAAGDRISGRSPTSRAAACRATCPGRAARASGPALEPDRWPMPSVMRLVGALGGVEDAEIRATLQRRDRHGRHRRARTVDATDDRAPRRAATVRRGDG